MKESGLNYVIPEPAKFADSSGYKGLAIMKDYELFYTMVSDKSDRIINFKIEFLGCPQNEMRAIAQSIIQAFAPELSESEVQALLDECQVGVEGITDTQKADCRGVYFAFAPSGGDGVDFYVGTIPFENNGG